MKLNPVSIALGLAFLAFGIAVAIDAGKLPDHAFQAVGTKKSTWQIWPVVGGLLCGLVALIMGIIWFSSKRAQVAAAASGGPGSYSTPPPPPPPPS